jgi:hypothetical protein
VPSHVVPCVHLNPQVEEAEVAEDPEHCCAAAAAEAVRRGAMRGAVNGARREVDASQEEK